MQAANRSREPVRRQNQNKIRNAKGQNTNANYATSSKDLK